MSDLAGGNCALRLHVLGGFRLETAARATIQLASRKAPALLAYLALCPGMTATPSADVEALRQQILDSITTGRARPSGPDAGKRKGWVDTAWASHSVRGFLAGAIKKKLGLTIASEKDEVRGRTYKIDT